MPIKNLSVFMPAYNEEANIAKTLQDTSNFLKTLNIPDYEILVINDGSKDATAQIVTDFSKKDTHIKLINHEVNKGYGEAVKTGFYSSKKDYIFLMDSDGQFEISDLTKFIDKISEADIVVGYRVNRQDHLMRIINGWGWTQISNTLFGLNLKDVDCAFKLFKREVIDKIPKLESTRGAMINPETLAKAKKMGFKIVQVGVIHKPRIGGKQTGANLSVITSSFIDLLKLWWKIK
jgi:glycosyltransferase involved in cell wall biosynthesis